MSNPYSICMLYYLYTERDGVTKEQATVQDVHHEYLCYFGKHFFLEKQNFNSFVSRMKPNIFLVNLLFSSFLVL